MCRCAPGGAEARNPTNRGRRRSTVRDRIPSRRYARRLRPWENSLDGHYVIIAAAQGAIGGDHAMLSLEADQRLIVLFSNNVIGGWASGSTRASMTVVPGVSRASLKASP